MRIKILLTSAIAAFVLACSIGADAQNNRATSLVPIVIGAGGTFQTIIPSGPKFSIEIQNNNTNTDNCFLDFGVRSTTGVRVTAGNATTSESILLAPGGSFQRYSPNSYVPQDEIEATCTSTFDTLRVSIQ
jgi:hypothetical protein